MYCTFLAIYTTFRNIRLQLYIRNIRNSCIRNIRFCNWQFCCLDELLAPRRTQRLSLSLSSDAPFVSLLSGNGVCVTSSSFVAFLLLVKLVSYCSSCLNNSIGQTCIRCFRSVFVSVVMLPIPIFFFHWLSPVEQ